MKMNVLGHEYDFITDAALFSPGAPDRGSLAMLKLAALSAGERVLDLGCGWGLIGIYAAGIVGSENVVMADISMGAVSASALNAERNGMQGVKIILSDGFQSIDETRFDVILSNPPYNSDFSVAKRFIEKGFNRLAVGGRMLMVTKRKTWYLNKFTAVFGGVKVCEADGYYVFAAKKCSMHYANKKQRTRA